MVSVIISNFNGRRFLDRLLNSLRAQRGVTLEIVVVDRESTDGSIEYLKAQPDVRLVSEPPLSGLVSGYAAGARVAKFPLLFFANEDLWLDPDCLALLAAQIQPALRIGIADPWEWDYHGIRLHHAGVWFEPVPWTTNWPWLWRQASFSAPLRQGERIPFPCAGAFLIHRDCYEDLGGFDTQFFLDYEDLDLGIRAWQRGWQCVTVPESHAYHAVGASDTQEVQAAPQPVGRRRYISNRSNLFVLPLKTFSAPWVPLALLSWFFALAGNVARGRWNRALWDFSVLENVRRRLPELVAFRRANSSYNHYFPGERFFQVPEFQPRNDSESAPE